MEIKFRAFIKHLNCIADVISIDFSKKEVEVYLPDRDEIRIYFFDDVELLQFTGYKDRNEKKIYEGDILRVYCGDTAYITEVKFDQSAFCIGVSPLNLDYDYTSIGFVEGFLDFEVIGNKYTNPELLEGTE